MNGMTSDPRDHEAFVREIDLGAYESAVSSLPRGVIPRRKGMTWRQHLGAEIEAIGGRKPAPYTPHSTTCYLFRHPATLSTHRYLNEYQFYVPLESDPADGTRWYYGMFLGTRNVAAMVPSMSDICLAKLAKCVPHTSMTKVGTWTTSPANQAAGAFSASGAAYSATAGETASGVVSGRTVGLQFFATTNGGYGIVSIDGDFTRANLLPVFTGADYVAGRCRPSDVGKRYFSSYATAAINEFICLADDLPAGNHTILIEATGLKPSASSAARCYVERIYGVSTGYAVGDSEVYFVPVRWVNHLQTVSALCYVPQWAPVGSTNYQFMGANHSDNSTQSLESQTSLTLYVGDTDQASLAAGTFASGNNIVVRHVTTLAHADSLVTNVATKTRTYTMVAGRPHPLMLDVDITYSAAGKMQVEYAGMLVVGNYASLDVVSVRQNEFTKIVVVGNEVGIPMANDGSVANYRGGPASLWATGPKVEAWVELIDAIPDRRMHASNTGLIQDSTTANQDKAYLETVDRITYFPANTQRKFTIGYGAKPV